MSYLKPIPTGACLEYYGASAPSGYVMSDGLTIGSSASGATSRANADTFSLFSLLWNSISNAYLNIQDSAGVNTTRGANAAADFAANKRMPVPNSIDVFKRGAGAARTIGGVAYPTVNLGETILDVMQGHKHNDYGHRHYTHGTVS